MMRAAIESANKSLNQFPAKNGASDTMSPLTIMTGRPSPDYNNLRVEFGAYAQVFEANDPTNTVKARTTGAIALTPTGAKILTSGTTTRQHTTTSRLRTDAQTRHPIFKQSHTKLRQAANHPRSLLQTLTSRLSAQ